MKSLNKNDEKILQQLRKLENQTPDDLMTTIAKQNKKRKIKAFIAWTLTIIIAAWLMRVFIFPS